MIDHVSVGVRDLERSVRFYEAVLGALGYIKHDVRPATVGFGKRRNSGSTCGHTWALYPITGITYACGRETPRQSTHFMRRPLWPVDYQTALRGFGHSMARATMRLSCVTRMRIESKP